LLVINDGYGNDFTFPLSFSICCTKQLVSPHALHLGEG
jgi:hypothetical protein